MLMPVLFARCSTIHLMPVTHTRKSTRARASELGPRLDPHLRGAAERVKAAAEELKRLGIADTHGKRIRSGLPKDMREGAERDFGG